MTRVITVHSALLLGPSVLTDAIVFWSCFEVRLASELLRIASCQSVALWILFRMSIMHCTAMHRACLLYYWLLWYHTTHKMTYAVTEC